MAARTLALFRFIAAIAVAAAVTVIPVAGTIYTSLFGDDFGGETLDLDKWRILEQAGHIGVAGGLLILEGGEHKQVVSTVAFAPGGDGLVARSRIRLAGDYQKFGWNVNFLGSGPTRGYYFDTYERGDPRPEFAGHEHRVRALGYEVGSAGAITKVLDVDVPVSWYEFHEFAVEWTASAVVFRIDNQEVARLADSFTLPLSIGVWNDRGQRMEFDWVDVSRFVRTITIPLDIKPDSFPNAIAPHSQGVIPVAVLATASFDPSSLDLTSVRFGATGAEAAATHWAAEDVNADGRSDLLLHFPTERTGIHCGTTEAALTGATSTGLPVKGSDTVRTVGCSP